MIVRAHTPVTFFRSIVRFIRTIFSRNPVVATPAVESVRELRCLHCEENINGQCAQCTCVISLKTMIASERCPLGKWGKQTRFSTGL